MRCALPWHLYVPTNDYNRIELLTKKFIAEVYYSRVFNSWTYNIFLSGMYGHANTKELTMIECDKQLLKLGFILIPENQIERFEKKLAVLL